MKQIYCYHGDVSDWVSYTVEPRMCRIQGCLELIWDSNVSKLSTNLMSQTRDNSNFVPGPREFDTTRFAYVLLFLYLTFILSVA